LDFEYWLFLGYWFLEFGYFSPVIDSSNNSVKSKTFKGRLFLLIASAKFFLQPGQAVTRASAPVSWASRRRSLAVHKANPGLLSLTPPPDPQHQAYSLIHHLSEINPNAL
jgi:hypothetical protein